MAAARCYRLVLLVALVVGDLGAVLAEAALRRSSGSPQQQFLARVRQGDMAAAGERRAVSPNPIALTFAQKLQATRGTAVPRGTTAQLTAPMTPLPSVVPVGGPPVTSAPSTPALQGAALDINLPAFSNKELHVSVPGQNEFGVPMGNSMVTLFNGKMLSYDEIFYGMNRIWQDLGLWMMEKWHGVTFMQNPNDAVVLQQLIWDQKPQLLIEIGTHAGGAALFYSEVMRDYEAKPGATKLFTMDPGVSQLDPKLMDKVHYPNVEFMQGLSCDEKVLKRARELHAQYPNTLLIHDGDHSMEGVLRDLELYDPLIPVGSYIVVQDTALDRLSNANSANGMLGGAYQGVVNFLQGKGMGRYVIDKRYEFMLFSVHHNGWLKKVAP